MVPGPVRADDDEDVLSPHHPERGVVEAQATALADDGQDDVAQLPRVPPHLVDTRRVFVDVQAHAGLQRVVHGGHDPRTVRSQTEQPARGGHVVITVSAPDWRNRLRLPPSDGRTGSTPD